MKPHRIFIAINLPDSVKHKLLAYKEKWPEVSASDRPSRDGPARWTTPENLHLTLAFLGNTSNQELAEVCTLLQEVGERHSPFSLEFTKIAYGPSGKTPRMVWAVAERSAELLALQKDVDKTLGQGSAKSFTPHLTLARLKIFELRRIEPEELPVINEEISLAFPVQSMEIMESELRRSGPAYTVCQSVPLRKH